MEADQRGYPSSHGSEKCRCCLVASHALASQVLHAMRENCADCAAASCACLLLLLCLGVEGGHQPDDLTLLHHCVDVQHCLVPCTGNGTVSSLQGSQFWSRGEDCGIELATSCTVVASSHSVVRLLPSALVAADRRRNWQARAC